MAQKVPGSNSHKKKPAAKRPLEDKTFYLDLKRYPGEATLTKNLRFLGAKVEPLFSRSVYCVVTNRESARTAPNVGPFKVPTKPHNWTPLTPITNTGCHSPLFLNESSVDYMDSPTYTNSPVTDQNTRPLSQHRSMAMVQKAMLKKQGQGNADLIENCRQWNIKVVHVNDIFAKVEKIKSNYGAQFAAERKRIQNGERRLKPPFLKVEVSKKCTTWYKEFPSSTFDKKLADKVKEMYGNFKKFGNIEVVTKSAQEGFSKNKCHTKSPIAQFPTPTPSVSKSFSKVSETHKPSTAFSLQVGNAKRKVSAHGVVPPKKQKTSHGRKKKKNYCEICETYYVHLDIHLASEKHRIYMSDPMNYLEIQNIILSLPQQEDFLLSRMPLSSDIGQISDDVPLFSSQVANNLPAYSNTSGQLDKHFPTEQFDVNRIAPAGINDIDTEPYFDIDEHYVSPSCTSLDSLYLPYLEDSIDKVMSDTLEDNDIPLNLSNDGKGSVVNQLSNNCNQSINLTCLTVGESAVETLRNDNSAIENMSTLSSKRKLEEDHLNCNPPKKVPNSFNEVGNEIHKDVDEDTTLQPVSFVIECDQEHCAQCFECTECARGNSLYGSQLGAVNSGIPEDFQNPLVQVNSKRISNDSGISIEDSSSRTLKLPHSLQEEETEAALPEVEECSALDLSITPGLNVKLQESTHNFADETCAVSVLKAPVLDQSCEMPVEEHMPPLCLDLHGNKPETDVDMSTHEKSEDIEMTNAVSEMKCDNSLQDTSSPTLTICEHVPSDSQCVIPKQPTYSKTESTIAIDIGSAEHEESIQSPCTNTENVVAYDIGNAESVESKSTCTNTESTIDIGNAEHYIQSPYSNTEYTVVNADHIESKSTCSSTESTIEIDVGNVERAESTVENDIVNANHVESKSTCSDTESTIAIDKGNAEHEESKSTIQIDIGSEEHVESKSTCSNTEPTIANADDIETLKKTKYVLPTDDTREPNLDDENTRQALDTSNGFEATTVDIGTFCDSQAPLTDANLQNNSHVECQPVSYENQNILHPSDDSINEVNTVNVKESGDTEDLNILHNEEHKADAQHTDLTFSSEHKHIQQEAIFSKSECDNNTVDIGTFENSCSLSTPVILDSLENNTTQNTSSPTNELPQIESKTYQDKVISSSYSKDFAHFCEEATRSFNGIDSDKSSCESHCWNYSLAVPLEDADSSSEGDEWSPSEEHVNILLSR